MPRTPKSRYSYADLSRRLRCLPCEIDYLIAHGQLKPSLGDAINFAPITRWRFDAELDTMWPYAPKVDAVPMFGRELYLQRPLINDDGLTCSFLLASMERDPDWPAPNETNKLGWWVRDKVAQLTDLKDLLFFTRAEIKQVEQQIGAQGVFDNWPDEI